MILAPLRGVTIRCFREVFAEAIRGERPLETDAREGAKTVEACLSIIESSATGRVVRPDYNF